VRGKDMTLEAVQRATRLTERLLAFARRQPLEPRAIDGNRLVGGLCELLRRMVGETIDLETVLSGGLWVTLADFNQLENAILNLVLNARDAMPNGGTIEISARNMPALADHDLVGDFVRLDIADSGIGMSPDILAHAFEPFFTTKEVGSGSGLGLAQAHGFAKASGGAVRIESTPGRGTLVSLFLPRTLKSPAYTAELVPRHADQDADNAGQVLVVEDDDEVAALTVEMIHQLGYDTTRVASAEAALGALADRRSVDIVFSDVMMPGRMNGVELAQEIRRRRPNLPVLLTSGYAEAARRKAGSQQIKIIPKPYRIDELRDALAAVRQDTRKSIREH
jgi:CheY-like chemotaxis protein